MAARWPIVLVASMLACQPAWSVAPAGAAAGAAPAKPPASAEGRPRDLASLTPQDWATDLDAWVEQVTTRHVDPFRTCPRERFDAAVAALRARLPSLDWSRTLVEFARLAAMLGDPHTVLGVERFGRFRQLPVRMLFLDDGAFVAAATAEHRDLLGARIVAVDATPIDEVATRVATIAASDNRWAARELASSYGSIFEVLQALDVATAGDRLTLVLAAPTEADAKATRRVELEPIPFGARAPMASLPDRKRDDLPPSFRPRKGNASFETLPIGPAPGGETIEAVYFRYDACAESDPPMATLAANAVAALRSMKRPAFIIDLRNNGGGDSSIIRPLVDALIEAKAAEPALRRDHAIVALIGPRTRSSASMNALELRRRVGATLVGEPTGQRVNHLGEMRTFTLPRSGLRATYSTKFFRHDDVDADAVMPDVMVPVRSDDHFAGRDAALAWVAATG